jgi:hypothetical protein
VFAVAALVATEPAVFHLATRFMASGAPGNGEAAPGDHLQSDYRLWLAGHQLEHGRAPWIDPYSFQPEAGSTVNPAWWPFGLPYWPLDRLLGSVLAWNLFTLLCLVAAGLFAMLWLLELEMSFLAAAAGGLAFEIAPYRVMQSRGHLLGPISLLLPLALWAFERALRTERRAWWLVSWLALLSIPLSGQVHLALGTIPFYFLYAVCRSTERRVLVAGGIGVVVAVLAGVLIRLTVIEKGGRSLGEVRVYSATGLDFLTRHARHGVESFVFLGWLTPLLAIGGLVVLLRGSEWRLAVALGVGAVMPTLMALGTHFPLYSTLWHAFPPLRYPRVPERLMPIACLCLAALAALAIDWGLRRPEAGRVPPLALAAIVAVLLFADLHVRAFHPTTADGSNTAYAAVKQAPAGRLVEVPAFLPDLHYGSVYLYYEQRVLRERPLGYSTTASHKTDVVARHLRPLDCGDWTTDVASRLAILKVSTITLHRGLFVDNPLIANTAWMAWQGLVSHGWRPVATDGAVTTFVRGSSSAEPPFPAPSPDDDGAIFCQGWFPKDELGHQMSDSHATFWVHGAGTLNVFLGAPELMTVRISVDGHPHSTYVLRKLFYDLPTLVDLPGKRWHLVALDMSRLSEIRGKPRGARVITVALR